MDWMTRQALRQLASRTQVQAKLQLLPAPFLLSCRLARYAHLASDLSSCAVVSLL